MNRPIQRTLGTRSGLIKWARRLMFERCGAGVWLAEPEMKSDKEFIRIYKKCEPFTMTSIEKMYSLYKAVNYICSAKIKGDFVECGVWKGGSAMIVAEVFKSRGEVNRNIYLFDTYSGMSLPETVDVTNDSRLNAFKVWRKKTRGVENDWCYASEEEVRNNLYLTGYPKNRVKLIKGKVEDTLTKKHNLPKGISLLRLDTDWYRSTKIELEVLYPRLSKGGILFLDDYGYWKGAKQAVDEYFGDEATLLHRVDDSARLVVKSK